MKPFPLDDPRHGTRNGYACHLRRGEEACRPCLDAQIIYQREMRPRYLARLRAYKRLETLAFQELRRRYPDEFRSIKRGLRERVS